MATATISIGRGGNERMLSDGEWDNFTGNVRDMLRHIGAAVFVDAAESIGEWEGVAEQSRTWVASFEDSRSGFVTEWLEMTASVWEQDAIALTIGETTLVGPSTISEAE